MAFWRSVLSWRMLIVLMMGFSSGLPLLLIGSTLKAWLTKEGMDLTSIGLFSLVGLPYTLKFLWAPFLDRFSLPGFGRRRGWLIATQLALGLAVFGIAHIHPSEQTALLVGLALTVAFLSASQDIAVDAYRREILEKDELGLGSSLAVNGYRVALLFSGAFALYLADHMSWKAVYSLMALSFGVGLVTTWLAPEPKVTALPTSLNAAFVEPLLEFFKRPGAVMILAFILLYKVGDSMASEMTTPFYLKLGFTMTQVGAVAKLFGFWATIFGALLGGLLILRLGIYRALWVFGILQAVSTFGFSFLSHIGPDVSWLAAVIAFENLTGGMGTSAYAAFMAALTNKKFTATQYALLSSLMGVPRVIFGSSTGWLAEHFGWSSFFILCGLLAVPGLLLLFFVKSVSQAADYEETPSRS